MNRKTVGIVLVLALFVPGVIHSQTTIQSTGELRKEDFTVVPVNYVAPYQESSLWADTAPNSLRERALDTMIEYRNDGNTLNTAFREELKMPIVGPRFPYEQNTTGENIVRHGMILINPNATFTLLDTELILTTAGKEDGRVSYAARKTFPSTVAGIWYGPDGVRGTDDDEMYRKGDSAHHSVNELYHLCFGASFPDMDDVLRRVNESEENRFRTLTLRVTEDNGSDGLTFDSTMWIAGSLQLASIDAIPFERSLNTTRAFRVRAFSHDEDLTNLRLVVTIPGLPITVGSITNDGFTSLVREGANQYVFQLEGTLAHQGIIWEREFFLNAGVNERIEVAITSVELNATGIQSDLVVSDTLDLSENLLHVVWEPRRPSVELSVRHGESGGATVTANPSDGAFYRIERSLNVGESWEIFGAASRNESARFDHLTPDVDAVALFRVVVLNPLEE